MVANLSKQAEKIEVTTKLTIIVIVTVDLMMQLDQLFIEIQ